MAEKIFLSKISNLFFSKDFHRKAIFNQIYKSNHWRDYNKPDKNESVSGRGSDISSTNNISEQLFLFFKSNKINRILDIGCGDFLWMNLLLQRYNNFEYYLGLDIVSDLISKNNENYSNPKIHFKNFDIIKDKIPDKFDIVLVRDVFIHLENELINFSIKKLLNSDVKFICVTTTPSIKFNKDIKKAGRYRDINLEIEPFNFINPVEKFSDNGNYNDNKKDYLYIYKNYPNDNK